MTIPPSSTAKTKRATLQGTTPALGHQQLQELAQRSRKKTTGSAWWICPTSSRVFSTLSPLMFSGEPPLRPFLHLPSLEKRCSNIFKLYHHTPLMRSKGGGETYKLEGTIRGDNMGQGGIKWQGHCNGLGLPCNSTSHQLSKQKVPHRLWQF